MKKWESIVIAETVHGIVAYYNIGDRFILVPERCKRIEAHKQD